MHPVASFALHLSRRTFALSDVTEPMRASSQRDKGTENELGNPPLSPAASALGGTGAGAARAASLLVYPQKKGRDTRPRRRRVRAQRGASGDKPPKTRPRAARAPASFGVGVSVLPAWVRFALPASQTLILRPTARRVRFALPALRRQCLRPWCP
jgi:hypothetical protein